MATTIPITYGEFHDFPRMIQFQLGEEWFFLRSYFDEERDEYADVFDVYLLPFRSEDDVRANPYFWTELRDAVHLGQIPVWEIGLDETRRRTIDTHLIEQWLSAHKK
jgi:hypothetical protein